MEERYLYATAIPILLGSGGLTGRVAMQLYTTYGLKVWWIGQGWHPLSDIYAKRLASLPFTEEMDGMITRHLLAFAKERGRAPGIPLLIPCTSSAEAYLTRACGVLEEEFLHLPVPTSENDPLGGLLQRTPPSLTTFQSLSRKESP